MKGETMAKSKSKSKTKKVGAMIKAGTPLRSPTLISVPVRKKK
jgi:hypothetical protein